MCEGCEGKNDGQHDAYLLEKLKQILRWGQGLLFVLIWGMPLLIRYDGHDRLYGFGVNNTYFCRAHFAEILQYKYTFVFIHKKQYYIYKTSHCVYMPCFYILSVFFSGTAIYIFIYLFFTYDYFLFDFLFEMAGHVMWHHPKIFLRFTWREHECSYRRKPLHMCFHW